MDYSYEENEACDKANESMPPPAVPSLKMNGTKNRDITQEKAGKDIKYNQFKKFLFKIFILFIFYPKKLLLRKEILMLK